MQPRVPVQGTKTLDWDHHALREPSARAGTPTEGWRERGGWRAGTSCDVLPPRRHVQAFREIDPRDDGARAMLASLTWHLILYADEISPSNPLGTGPDHRNICGWYWSILELGPEVLCTEEVWMIAACIRSEVIARVDGGTGAVLRLLLDQIFFQEDGPHLSRSGIHLLD